MTVCDSSVLISLSRLPAVLGEVEAKATGAPWHGPMPPFPLATPLELQFFYTW